MQTSESTVPEEVKQELLSLPKNNFISNYVVASNMVQTAYDSHKKYWELIKACQKHISGEKPIPPDELRKKGLGWVWNFNYGKASAKIEKGVAESTTKISSALALGYATLRNVEDGDENDELMSFMLDDQKRGIVASVIGYALYSTLSKETRLSGWLNQVEYPAYAFGYCALQFIPFDWMPEAVHPLNIAFRPDTKPEEINTWITFSTITAEELYDRWVTSRNAFVASEDDFGKPLRIASSGWNLEGLEHVLLKSYIGKVDKDGASKTPEQWKEVIPSYIDCPSIVIQNTNSVNIAKIFHKELDGTLSETYIPWDNAWQMTTNKDGKPENVNQSELTTNHILFTKNHGKYIQSMHINLVRDSGFSSDSGCIQDLRGIARYSVEDSIRYNRLRNGIGNKMTFVGSPMFEQSNTVSGDKFKLTVSQGFILLPASHQLIEKQPNFDIASHINVLKFEEGEFMRDTQQYDATIQGRLTSRPNKGEVERITSEVEFSNNAKNNIKFRDYASIFLSVLNRMPFVKVKRQDVGYTGKKRFYDIVKKQLSWLVKTNADVDKILKAVESFAMEPVNASIDTIMMAMQMAETPFARNRLKRMLLIAKGFSIEEVNLSVPLITDKFSNMQDSRVAAIENDMFFTTNEVVIGGTDDDQVHLDSHLAKCDRVIKGVNAQAISPVDAFKYLENNLAHCALHCDQLGRNPAFNEKAKEYLATVDAMNANKNKIRAIAEKMLQAQQEAQQQTQLDPKTQADIADKNARAQSDTARKDWLAQQRTGQRDKQIDQSHEQRMRELDLKHEDERLKLSLELGGQQPQQ